MKIKLSNVRLSFPCLFEAVQYNGMGPFKYRAQFLLEDENQKVTVMHPDGPSQVGIKDAIAEVAKERWAKTAQTALNALAGDSQKFCFIDGARKTSEATLDYWILTATRDQTKGRPIVLDQNKAPLTEQDGRPYGGCFVNATVDVWAQDNEFGKGLRATLLGVQFLKDGDKFGAGGAPSSDDFDQISVEDENDISDLV